LFGVFIITMAASLVIRPRDLTGFMLKHAGDRWLHLTAAGARLVLGIVLIRYAPLSHFPLTLHLLGWIALAAGILILVTPLARFEQLIRWFLNRLGKFTLVAGLLAVLFGAFLIYAVT
jgi:hypothetical protein